MIGHLFVKGGLPPLLQLGAAGVDTVHACSWEGWIQVVMCIYYLSIPCLPCHDLEFVLLVG